MSRPHLSISGAAPSPFLMLCGCFVLRAAVTETQQGWKCQRPPVLYAGRFMLGSFGCPQRAGGLMSGKCCPKSSLSRAARGELANPSCRCWGWAGTEVWLGVATSCPRDPARSSPVPSAQGASAAGGEGSRSSSEPQKPARGCSWTKPRGYFGGFLALAGAGWDQTSLQACTRRSQRDGGQSKDILLLFFGLI